MEFFKKNWKWLSIVALIIYTIIVVVITINSHNAYLRNKITSAFSDAFDNVFSTDDNKSNITSENDKIDNNNEDKINGASSQNDIVKGPKKEITNVNFGESITTDDWVTSLINYRIAKKIEPAKKTSYYTYYEAEEGNQFLAIDLEFKNLFTEKINTYNMIDMTLKYENKYTYTSPIKVVEESDGDYTGYDWYFDVEPLKAQKLHYLFELPDEVVNNDGSIDVYFTIGENEYKLNIQ